MVLFNVSRSAVPRIKMLTTHIKCRKAAYPKQNAEVLRVPVPDDKVSWDVEWLEYTPLNYTSKSVFNKPWADPDLNDVSFKPKWNQLDGKIDRTSFMGKYKIIDGAPLNPIGRTGLRGRGVLGRWGPNHAADPIVTRWKRRGKSIERHPQSEKGILQFIAIRRRDCHEIAIPGGMVDAGEVVSQTLKREFLEEALNSLQMDTIKKKTLEDHVKEFFSAGEVVYKGYVDDPRNTDNAWMETAAQNFHDEEGGFVDKLQLQAGDDAAGVCWVDISKDLQLYASHLSFIEIVAKHHNAHW